MRSPSEGSEGGVARLLITADDAGVCDRIDRGIATLSNVVKRIAIVVNYGINPSVAFKDCKDVLFGIHLNVSSGLPVSEPGTVPSLVDRTGCFKAQQASSDADSLPHALDRIFSIVESDYSETHLATEIHAQLHQFRQVMGAAPAFLSVHHDLDQSALVSSVLQEACPDLPGRQAMLRSGSLASYTYKLFQKGDGLSQAVGCIRSIIGRAVSCSRASRGMPSEVVCHPGYVPQVSGFTLYREQRDLEREAWASEGVQSLFAKAVWEKGAWRFNAGFCA